MKRHAIDELRHSLRGTHTLVWAGNGGGRNAELLFETVTHLESEAIHDLIDRLVAARRAPEKEKE